MKVLMCPPTYYGIPAIENPSMDPNEQPDMAKAWRQWITVANLYERLGMNVYLIEPQERMWDLVFTANGAWGRNGRFVLSNFRQPIRRAERPHYREWLTNRLGYKTFELPEQVFSEGQGDAISLKDLYLFGYGFRSSPEAMEYVRELLRLEKPCMQVRLVDPTFYHLDTCAMSFPTKDVLMYYPGAFDEESLAKLRKLPIKRKEVSKKLAECFVCNSVYVGNTILVNVPFRDISEKSMILSARGVLLSKSDFRYREILEREPEYQDLFLWIWRLGYEIIPVYTSEFLLSGAGVRCLTLFLE